MFEGSRHEMKTGAGVAWHCMRMPGCANHGKTSPALSELTSESTADAGEHPQHPGAIYGQLARRLGFPEPQRVCIQ